MKKLLVVLMFVLVACSSPFIPDGAKRFQPYPEYATWWTQMEECSGRTGHFEYIQWWMMPGLSFENEDRIVWAITSGNAVTVAEGQIFNPYVVRHEMLHILGFSHPGAYWPDYPWPFHGCADVQEI